MREGPVIYRHDIGPIEALGMAGALAYGKLDSRLMNHIEDSVRHITDKERSVWNNKVNKEEYNSFISSIKNEISAIKTTIANYNGTIDDSSAFITNAQLMTILQNYVSTSVFNDTNTVPSSISGYISNRAQSAVEDVVASLFAYDETEETLTIPA